MWWLDLATGERVFSTRFGGQQPFKSGVWVTVTAPLPGSAKSMVETRGRIPRRLGLPLIVARPRFGQFGKGQPVGITGGLLGQIKKLPEAAKQEVIRRAKKKAAELLAQAQKRGESAVQKAKEEVKDLASKVLSGLLG